MAETISNYQQGSISTPATNDPLSSSVVRGHFQSLRTVHNSHDAESGVHFQSSTLASRPAAGVTGRKWYTTDDKHIYYDNGATWDDINYVKLDTTGAVAGSITITNNNAYKVKDSGGTARGGLTLNASNIWIIGDVDLQSHAAVVRGTGITFQTSGSNRWEMQSGGHLIASTDNAIDIGNGTNRPRDIYIANQINIGSSAIAAASANLAHGYSITATNSVPGDGKVNFIGAAGILAFFGATGTTKQTITGSRGGNAALADLLSSLASYGLITDSSSA